MSADAEAGRGRETVTIHPAELAKTNARDWLIRFGFGAGVSAVAGAVSAVAGPKIGGLLLAFPAILLASLTLVAQEEGNRQARDDARGATFGTLGLLAFAVTAALLAVRAPMWLALSAACAAWLVVALAAYFTARRGSTGEGQRSSVRRSPESR